MSVLFKGRKNYELDISPRVESVPDYIRNPFDLGTGCLYRLRPGGGPGYPLRDFSLQFYAKRLPSSHQSGLNDPTRNVVPTSITVLKILWSRQSWSEFLYTLEEEHGKRFPNVDKQGLVL